MTVFIDRHGVAYSSGCKWKQLVWRKNPLADPLMLHTGGLNDSPSPLEETAGTTWKDWAQLVEWACYFWRLSLWHLEYNGVFLNSFLDTGWILERDQQQRVLLQYLNPPQYVNQIFIYCGRETHPTRQNTKYQKRKWTILFFTSVMPSSILLFYIEMSQRL